MGSHYFDVNPTVAMERGEVGLTVDGRHLTLATARGVFGWQRVDAGTGILIQYGPTPPADGDLLDLGCGYGPITVALGTRAPGARIWGVEVNERAIDLARENATRAGLTNVRVVRPDEVPADLRFSAIYSNPPIKIGKASLHDLLAQWLPRLLPDGRAYLVVKRSMGADTLERWLAERGWASRRLRSKSGYRIIEASASDLVELPEDEPA